eukprot:TRINITY_DN1505_c0_g1_i1.p1 TRINITY_DN1505_c0_g1~~TRINITY_DN1505_c0_g1_i1.p1  ORF type:complete len:119 (+),score=16.25 TRINITY_DN1505_c0_g1_i1:22-357(+)
MAKDGYVKPAASGMAAGLNKGFIVTRRELPKKPSSRKGRNSVRNKLAKEVVREVAGFAPYERRMIELLKIGTAGTQKRALKLAKKRLGTHKRGKKKREEMGEAVAAMRRKG